MKKGVFVLLSLFALGACSGGRSGGGGIVPAPASGSGSPAAAAVGATTSASGAVDVTLIAGRDVPVDIHTTPGARCTLPSGTAQPASTFTAGVDGLLALYFSLAPSTEAATSSFTVECKSGGAVVSSVPIAVHALAGSVVVPESRRDLALVKARDVDAAVQRLGFDPRLASTETLHANHLPARPSGTAGYESWLRTVTSPVTKFVSTSIPMPGVKHGPTYSTTSQIWSGYAVSGGLYNFVNASGDWSVPPVATKYIGQPWYGSYASVWVGIDGFGTNDVVQDGTTVETHMFTPAHGGAIVVSNYYAWWEYYPAFSNQWFNVRPGDDMYCEAYTEQPTSPTANGVFYCKDNTTGFAAGIRSGTPAGVQFQGSTVEWVVERPTVNGSVTQLARYNTMRMRSAIAFYTSNGASFGYSDVANWNITMVGSTTLSTAQPGGELYSIDFIWHAYQ